MKELWVKNFDIKRVDINLPCEATLGFQNMVKKTIGVSPVNESVWVIKNLDNTGTYFKKQELRRVIDLTIKKILSDPSHIDSVHKKAVRLNRQLFGESSKVRKIKLTDLSNRELLALHKKHYALIAKSHMWAIATTWFLDSDGEDYSKYLMSIIERRLEAEGAPLVRGAPSDAASVFSILTTPAKKSFQQIEEEESLQLVAAFQSNSKVKKWFTSHSTPELARTLDKLTKNFRSRVAKHHYKWLWMPYTYIGPAYRIDYYLEVWRGLLRQGINPSGEILKKRKRASELQNRRRQIIRQLKLSAYEKHLFDIAADIVWIKGFRKDCLFYGIYVLDLVLAEIGRRAGLSLIQVKYLSPYQDIPRIFSDGGFSELANQRIKFCVLYGVRDKANIYTGRKAAKFLSGLNFEKIKIVKSDSLTGTCACPGQALGIAKVVNVPDDIPKMKKGDIMLAHATYPALVPAMKLAAAIVTEEGGITCHAAIVARELQTPCVVGIKHLLSVLKDGDKIQVDANSGVIKKL
ncbi:MAG: PEP-utilizing enzyme [bacterium]|nr:PEP-utilizing enzyme [bacterium]